MKAEVKARQTRQQVVQEAIRTEHSSQKQWRNIVRCQRHLSAPADFSLGRNNIPFYLNPCFEFKSSVKIISHPIAMIN